MIIYYDFIFLNINCSIIIMFYVINNTHLSTIYTINKIVFSNNTSLQK